MGLTAKAIDNAKPQSKSYKLTDGGGLCVLVSPTGARLWRWRYRFGGKEKMMALGETLAEAMMWKGVPEHIRSDNGPEFIARDLRKWLAGVSAKPMYIEPGSPWENGYCESFNSKLQDEFLKGEIFYSMKELRVLASRWQHYYNTDKPHSALGYRPPAPEAILPPNTEGHGDVESKRRFPHPHTPDCGYGILPPPQAALN